MNILSLFDGMSCGQIALNRSGIKYDKYFASEIDSYAIKVTMANYPDTIQLGSVINVNGYDLPKIDLLMGGSPCQSFSFAGKRQGMSTVDNQEILTLEHYLDLKSQGYEFEGQSYLFWEYVRLLTEVKPKYFLLENVQMSENWEKVISKALGVNPILIDSSLLSAQSRKRLYWTNIGLKPSGLFGYLSPTIELPKDKKIMLKDILQNEVDSKYFLSEKMIKKMVVKPNDASVVCHNLQRRNPDRPSIKKNKNAGGSGHLSKTDGKSYCLDIAQSNAVEIKSGILRTHFDGRGFREIKSGKGGTIPARARQDGSGQNVVQINLKSKNKRLYQTINDNNIDSNSIKALDLYNQSVHDRYPTLTAPNHNDRALYDGGYIRRLTPIETERLQTVPDNYTSLVSDTQRYKMLGNGWTIDVICHILNYIKK